ncbi:Hpt domain-containing protein [Arthrobacter sp. R-11]|uniref:Hpt domain-containing protein n=1 Tax=Arthrobacter sp. R-11 TaxID=3404053 RepID=UPI003CFA8411
MNACGGRSGVLVDPAVLNELRVELGGDHGAVGELVRNYVKLLPARIDRLQRAVDALDKEEGLDAVLSLKTSSAMVGARCLSLLAAELEVRIRLFPVCDDAAELSASLEELGRCARGTVTGLVAACGLAPGTTAGLEAS